MLALKVPTEAYKNVEELSNVTSKSLNILLEQSKFFDKNKILQKLNKFKNNKINHIINGSKTSNHKWEKLVPDKNWSRIKSIIIEALETGEDELYKAGASRVKMIDNELVQVTYKKLFDGTIKIGNAWIK